jgi:hypothetical protein
MEDTALTAMGFAGRGGFQYNYDLCLMVEYGPRANDVLNWRSTRVSELPVRWAPIAAMMWAAAVRLVTLMGALWC